MDGLGASILTTTPSSLSNWMLSDADAAQIGGLPLRQLLSVQTGDMGSRSYLRHGRQSWAEGIVEGLQGLLFQIDISGIIVHK